MAPKPVSKQRPVTWILAAEELADALHDPSIQWTGERPAAERLRRALQAFDDIDKAVERLGGARQFSVAIGAQVREVFDTWVQATQRSRCALDGKRQKLILTALEQYSVADLRAAVCGWRYIDFNAGINQEHRVWNDLELLLRDAKHIERFRDAYREHQRKNDGGAEVPVPESLAEQAAHLRERYHPRA